MMEGSGSGSILVTNGSRCGSERPKNIQILRIRIRNTGMELWEGIDILIFALYTVGTSFSAIEKQHPKTGLYRFKDSHKDGKTARINVKLIYVNEGPNDELISVRKQLIYKY